MYKRALLLTAATIALLSGPALADTTISTKTTAQLKTSTSENIELTDTSNNAVGSVEIPSSNVAPTAPAIDINSSNTVTLDSGTTVSFKDTTDAIGIQEETTGITGELINNGTIDLTGSGTSKIGILIGNTSATGSFNGVLDSADYVGQTPSTVQTAVYLGSGSVVTVQGDGSFGLELGAGQTVNGSIYDDGEILVTSSSSSSSAGIVTGLSLDQNSVMNGNLTIATSGSVEGAGQNAVGVMIGGELNGQFLNQGAIYAFGSTKSATKTTGNATGGYAVAIEGSISGGFYNFGPAGTVTNSSAIISSNGAQTMIIANNASLSSDPITIGSFSDPSGVFADPVSFLNRGVIRNAPVNTNTSSLTIQIAGSSAANDIVFDGMLANTGTISSVATDTAAAGTVAAQALQIGNYVSMAGGISNESDGTNTGFITATASSASTGTAVAIGIGTTTYPTTTTVPTLYNSGTIAATATTTDGAATNLSAWAILDNTGSLLNIINAAGGDISAASSTLENNMQVARAIDLEAATGNITLTNNGSIYGDVLLGSGNDTVTVVGASQGSQARIVGSIDFGGTTSGYDTLTIGDYGTVTGAILNKGGGELALTIDGGGTLNLLNDGTMPFAFGANAVGSVLPGTFRPGLLVSTLQVNSNGMLNVTLSQAFNDNAGVGVYLGDPVISAVNSIDLENSTTTVFAVNYGSYVRGVGTAPAQFILLDAPVNQITLGNAGNFISDLTTSVPFLFTGSVCGVNMSAYSEFSTCTDAHATPDSQVILELTPKTADDLDLKGYARKMFAIANTALVNDPALGAAVINAGVGVSDPTVGDKLYQGIYSEFAPDVTGSQRAIGIALTDQSSGPVGARQRALRMYAGQDGDATLWGQEFVERLNVSSTANATGYADTGFGFALGMDVGDPHDGRYGAALTFYSGDTNERPRTSRTNSEWYMLTGYSDWRSKGMFFDSQISAGYGSIDGKRTMIFSDPGATCGTQTDTFCRTAEGNRSSELLAGGFTTGFIVNEGGTVMIPQISLDGLTMRQEGYHESSSVKNITAGTDGFDLNVKPSYANSLRAFTGVDMRQDLRFDGFYFQPEARAGFRYDFIDGADKLKAEFACSTTSISAENCGDTGFSITGPDPARANVVVGGGFALTTGAWSLGVNYDYTRGFGGTDGTNQTGTLTLLGRI